MRARRIHPLSPSRRSLAHPRRPHDWARSRRHIALSLAVAVVCGTFGVVGLAAAGMGDAALPETFGLPMPGVGDRGEYVVRHEPRGPAGEAAWEMRLRFTFQERALRPATDGSLVPVDVIVFESIGQPFSGGVLNTTDEWWMEPDGATVAVVHVDPAAGGIGIGGTVRSDPVNGTTCEGTQACGTSARRSTHFGDAAGHLMCGFRSGLQGATIRVGEDAPSLPRCSGLRATTMVGPALDEVEGRPAMRMQPANACDGPCESRVSPNPRLWFVPEVPYPLRVEMTFANSVVTYTLVAFEAGSGGPGESRETEASQGSAALTEKPAPAWTKAPRQPWGVDPVGPHPFPLSEAWRVALESEGGSLQAFLERHPDAAVVWADLAGSDTRQEWRFPGTGPAVEGEEAEQAWTWAFVAAAGADSENVLVTKTLRNRTLDGPGGPLDDPLAPVWGRPAVEYRFGTLSMPDPEPLSVLPEELPTPESAWARWSLVAAVDGIEGSGVTYGFSLLANDYGNWETQGEGAFWGGRQVLARNVSHDRDQVSNVQSTMTFTFGGNALGASSLSGSADTADPDGAPPLLQSAAASGLATSWPWQATAAGGLGGLLAGALYYLFPGIKGGALALFSRHAPGPSPDSPARSVILEFVGARPGVHYREIVRGLGISKGAAEHHLRILVAEGRLVARSSGGRTCYFLPGSGAPMPVDSAGRLLEALRTPRRPAELAALTGLAPATISYHLGRLERLGKIRRQDGYAVAATIGFDR